jgi:hypothetical protein
MALDACIQTEFGEEQCEVCRFEEEEHQQQQQIPDVFSLSLVFFLLGVFSFANLVAKHHGALLIVTVTATSAAYLLGGGGALICDFFLL